VGAILFIPEIAKGSSAGMCGIVTLEYSEELDFLAGLSSQVSFEAIQNFVGAFSFPADVFSQSKTRYSA
jgi:hypothetical protein